MKIEEKPVLKIVERFNVRDKLYEVYNGIC